MGLSLSWWYGAEKVCELAGGVYNITHQDVTSEIKLSLKLTVALVHKEYLFDYPSSCGLPTHDRLKTSNYNNQRAQRSHNLCINSSM